MSAYRARVKASESMIDASVAEVTAERDAAYDAAKTAAQVANRLVPFTDEQYKSARAVRDRIGWHKVVRVNAKSVTVETPYSWTDRIPRARIIEVR